MKNVLVTGGTGFLAGWIIRKLLEKGYTVRTTVRSESSKNKVIAMYEQEHVNIDHLSFSIADLTSTDGWDEAMEDIDYVLHVASPLGGDNHEDPALIPIAVNGVENVISSAIRNHVKKIVMTSTEGANYPDKTNSNPAIDESLWTDENNKWITNYKGTPSPNVIYPVVDVRDLADLHILAMENDLANGERFIAESEEMTMPEMAKLLKAEYPNKKVSTFVIPNFIISIMAKFQAPMKVLNTMIGLHYHRTNAKAKTILDWNPRSARKTILDTADYMIANNII